MVSLIPHTVVAFPAAAAPAKASDCRVTLVEGGHLSWGSNKAPCAMAPSCAATSHIAGPRSTTSSTPSRWGGVTINDVVDADPVAACVQGIMATRSAGLERDRASVAPAPD